MRLKQLWDAFPWLQSGWDKLVLACSHSADPDLAIERLFNFLVDSGVKADDLSIGIISDFLVPLFAGSGKATAYLQKYPHHLTHLLSRNDLNQPKSYETFASECRDFVKTPSDFATLCQGMRRYRSQEFLRLAIRDLCMGADIMELAQELSHLADALLNVAYRECNRLLGLNFNVPFVIFAMGKLGGQELNYSSDIDLIYLYDPAPAVSTEDRIDAQKLQTEYSRLCEWMTRAMSSITEDGLCFRVDLDLRPDGRNGPIVNSLHAALVYYETWGATWERVALLKARPAAGDLAFGKKCLKTFEPFIYRKYLDLSVMHDLAEMKRKIDRTYLKPNDSLDLKLAHGGIREIEFIVHTLQLIHAGRDQTLRTTGTLETLNRLRETGILPEKDADILNGAYRFLRMLEQRIQMDEERQTHKLPDQPEKLHRLAQGLKFTPETLNEKLTSEMTKVYEIFQNLFARSIPQSPCVPPHIQDLFQEGLEAGEGQSRLKSFGFESPETAWHHVVLLKDLSRHQGSKAQIYLSKLLPRLMEAIIKAPNPDMAISFMERFIHRIGARTTFYELLLDSPALLTMLTQLFGSSEFLSQILITHPEVIDSLLLAPFACPEKTLSVMQAECSSFVDDLENYEDRLLALRRFKNLEILRIGMNDIAGSISYETTTEQLTNLAEVCLRKAFEMTQALCLNQFGAPIFDEDPLGQKPKWGEIAVLALGKLGGSELSYSSDLDLILIYDVSEVLEFHKSFTDASILPTRLSAHTYFTKFAQRLISALSLPSEEGFLYKIDTRLRPSGNAGPLVSSLSAFTTYHSEQSARSARSWEHLALIKVRFVAGSSALADRAVMVLHKAIYERLLDPSSILEIDAIRGRIEKELAQEKESRYNVKMGKGGLIDIEFIVQLFQLQYGHQISELKTTNTQRALANLSYTACFSEPELSFLKDAYRFLRKLENALRIVHDRPIDDLTCLNRNLDQVAGRLGYKPSDMRGEQLLKDYLAITSRVREIYTSSLQKLSSEPMKCSSLSQTKND